MGKHTQALYKAVRESVREYDDLTYPEDVAHEVADSHVPVYHNQLRDLVIEDWTLLTEEPEVEAAEWWGPALRIVVGNLYERLYAIALEELELVD